MINIETFVEFASVCKSLADSCPAQQTSTKAFLNVLKDVLGTLSKVVKFAQSNPALTHACSSTATFALLIRLIKHYMNAIKICPSAEAILSKYIQSARDDIEQASKLTGKINTLLGDKCEKILSERDVSDVITKMGEVAGCLLAAEGKLKADSQCVVSLIASQRRGKQVYRNAGIVLLLVFSAVVGYATVWFAPKVAAAFGPVFIGGACAIVSIAVMIMGTQNSFGALDELEERWKSDINIGQNDMKREQEKIKSTRAAFLRRVDKNGEKDFIGHDMQNVSDSKTMTK